MAEQSRIMMLYSVIGRGKGKEYKEMLNAKNIRSHIQMAAFGTAPSEMMDIFGLGSNDKDVVISFAPQEAVRAFTTELGKNISTNTSYGGIVMSLPIAAINRISAEIINRVSGINNANGEETMTEENKFKQQLILIVVNQGFTDQVMQTAKRAGAMGGTVLRGRFTGNEGFAQFGEIDIQEEKEIISILAPATTAAQVMNEVNRLHGAKTEAHGMVIALPVEKAYKV